MAAQLTLISLDEALALLLDKVARLNMERVALELALGRTLAEPVTAAHNQPAEPRATMDGVAVPDADPPVGTCWRLVGEVAASPGRPGPLRSGEAVRIGTGAVVPPGVARIIPQEIIRFSKDTVELAAAPAQTQFIRRPGTDFQSGERLVESGTVISPAVIGTIAAANLAAVDVCRQPVVAILTAGDELVRPGSALGTGHSIDSASQMIGSLVRTWGAVPHVEPLLADELEPIATAMSAAMRTADIVLCIGGASVGRRDFMRPAARSLGAHMLFEGIAVQPGKPCWHARTDGGKLILGLPGNPTSAFVCAHLLLRPLIEQMLRGSWTAGYGGARLKTSLPANGSREQFFRASASLDDDGQLWAEPIGNQDSGLQAVLAKAQLLVRRPAGAEKLAAGSRVEVIQTSQTAMDMVRQ